MVYPVGNPEGPTPNGVSGAGWMSVYLEVADAMSQPSGWSQNVQFSLTFISQTDERPCNFEWGPTSHTFKMGEDDWGRTQHLKLTDLNDTSKEYLKNDTLIIKCDITNIASNALTAAAALTTQPWETCIVDVAKDAAVVAAAYGGDSTYGPLAAAASLSHASRPLPPAGSNGAAVAAQRAANPAAGAAVAEAVVGPVEMEAVSGAAVAAAVAAANEGACVTCGVDDDDGLLCDGCDAVFHTACAGLTDVPEGDWFCQLCADAGVTEPGAGVAARAAVRATVRAGH